MSHVNIDAATRSEAVRLLDGLLKHITLAEAQWSQGDDPAAMRSLLKARSAGGQVTATVIANCLRQALATVDSPDRYTREQGLDEFFRLIAFVESTLCPTCRGRVAAKLKENR